MFGNDVKFGIRSHTVTEKGFQLTTFEMGPKIFVFQLFTYDHKLIFACFVTYLQFCQVTTQLLHNNALTKVKYCPNSIKKNLKKIKKKNFTPSLQDCDCTPTTNKGDRDT